MESITTPSMDNISQLSFTALSLMILTTSFFGSWHCVGMCSPLASIAANQKQLLAYHVGRISAYVFLGGVAGYIGSFFLGSDFKWLQSFSIVFLSLTLLTIGFFSLFNYDVLSKIKFHKAMTVLFKFQKKFKLNSGYWIGLLTGLLPCGWLYTFLLAAVASKSPFAGAFILFLFALGSVPALSTVSLLVKQNIAISNDKKRKIAGGILIFAGLYSLLAHFFFGLHHAEKLFGL
jgi:sulfite exporter TauE/SafE